MSKEVLIEKAQRLQDTIAAWVEASAQQECLVRELDVALNGEGRADKQASLRDLVAQVKRMQLKQDPADQADELPDEQELRRRIHKIVSGDVDSRRITTRLIELFKHYSKGQGQGATQPDDSLIEEAFTTGREVGEIAGRIAVKELADVRYKKEKLELAYKQLLTEIKRERIAPPPP